MSKLTQLAEQRIRNIQRRPDLPHWWQLAAYGMFGLFFVYLGWEALTVPGGRPNVTAAPDIVFSAPPDSVQPPIQLAPPPDSPTPSAPPTAGGPATPAGDGAVAVATLDGGQVNVPSAAYEVARSATFALFTTDFTLIPFAVGAAAPTGLTVYPNPTVEETYVKTVGSGLYTFTTIVDPDGPGGQPQRATTVTVVQQGGSWVFARVGD
jgi:hypothetical protein